MSNDKFRLITRADFDGVVCGALFHELDMVDDVRFAEPWQMQQGEIAIGDKDISANLPYAHGVRKCFDHHVSETARVAGLGEIVNDPEAPSTARVVYEHFGGAERFPAISPALMAEVDRADSADYEIDDILAPDHWTMLNFLLDPRTGLGRYRSFSIPDEQLMRDMMTYCRHTPIDEILQIPDVEERLHCYQGEVEYHEMQLRRNATVRGATVVVDLRGESVVRPGNRFMIYGLYPDSKASVVISPRRPDDGRVEIAVGKSIIDRSSTANIGRILLDHGGGGHHGAGTCRLPEAEVDAAVDDILGKLAAG